MTGSERFITDARAAARGLERLLRGKSTSLLSPSELASIESVHDLLRSRAHDAARLAVERSAPTADTESSVGVGWDDLAALLALDSIRGFGPQKFRDLWARGITPREIFDDPGRLPTRTSTERRLQAEIARVDEIEMSLARERAAEQIDRASSLGVRVLTHASPHYPRNVLESNNAVPVLWALGNTALLKERKAVACVGSRAIRPPYVERQRSFAAHAADRAWVVVSGFAQGADTVAHEAAVAAGGSTVLVMPCGLDRPFPPENKDLWRRLLGSAAACAVSEFPLGMTASSLTLRKRNKLIVACALGVLIAQTSATGGAMNAYRFAGEQRKPVATFSPDGSADTSGNRTMLESFELEFVPESRQKPRAHATTFSAANDDRAAYERWLTELSSSI